MRSNRQYLEETKSIICKLNKLILIFLELDLNYICLKARYAFIFTVIFSSWIWKQDLCNLYLSKSIIFYVTIISSILKLHVSKWTSHYGRIGFNTITQVGPKFPFQLYLFSSYPYPMWSSMLGRLKYSSSPICQHFISPSPPTQCLNPQMFKCWFKHFYIALWLLL